MIKIKRLVGRHGVLLAGLLGIAAMGTMGATALGATAFTASARGTGAFQSGTLLLSKANSTGTCLSSSNAAGSITSNVNSGCAGSDGYAGTIAVPGAPASQTLTLTNQGSATAQGGLSMSAGSCTGVGNPIGVGNSASATGNDTAGICGLVQVTIENETGTVSCLYPAQAGACPALSANYTLASLAGSNLLLASSLGPGANDQIKTSVKLGPGWTQADQALTAALPLTYTLSQ